jgi:hypothetical protein
MVQSVAYFRSTLAGLAAALSLAATAASAAVIVDTGQPGVGQSNGNYYLDSEDWLASRFDVTTTTSLTDLTGWMFAQAAPGTFTVALYAGDEAPEGASLYSGTATANLRFAFYGVHGVSWLVGPGSYWVAFEVRPGDTMAGFMPDNPPAPQAHQAYYYQPEGPDYQAYDFTLAVRVNGDAVALPEPQTWALLIMGFAGVGASLRSRRGRRIAAL